MVKINLLAEGKRAVRKAKPTVALADRNWTNWALLGMVLLGLLVAGGWWFLLSREKSAVEESIAEAQVEIKRLEPILKKVEEYKQREAELKHKRDVIEGLKANQTGPARVMEAVSRALPDLLWIDGMSVSAANIQINGRAFNYNAISNFIENLDRVPEFREPRLARAAEAGPVYVFALSVDYKLEPPKKPEGEGAATTPTAAPVGAGG